MLPVVAVVVGIGQRVARLGQHLVQAHLRFGDALVFAFFVERAQVALGFLAVELRPGNEPVQMRIGPAERDLQYVVQFGQVQVTSELKGAPHGGARTEQFGAYAVGHLVRSARDSPAPRRRR